MRNSFLSALVAHMRTNVNSTDMSLTSLGFSVEMRRGNVYLTTVDTSSYADFAVTTPHGSDRFSSKASDRDKRIPKAKFPQVS